MMLNGLLAFVSFPFSLPRGWLLWFTKLPSSNSARRSDPHLEVLICFIHNSSSRPRLEPMHVLTAVVI